MSYFMVARPKSITGEGLFEVVQKSLNHFGIQAIQVDNCRKLIGFGTDRASANIANAGLKGIFERKWIYWSWCLAHHLELSLKMH